MKKTTVTLSLKERYTVGILAKQLHTTRSCVMHKALHVYAKALRYQIIRKKPFTKCKNRIYDSYEIEKSYDFEGGIKGVFHKKSHLRTQE